MQFIKKLFARKKKNTIEKETVNQAPMEDIKYEKPYVSQWYTYGMHMYRSADEDSSVWYINQEKGIRKLVVDKFGKILDFPGIQKEDIWTKNVCERYLVPQIRFRTDFERRNGKIIMLWQIQPDGRYWEDEDGFGMENDVEIKLYSFLDANGNFEAPFRLYKMGTQYFDQNLG